MRNALLALSTAAALSIAAGSAFADSSGAATGAVGGAVTGAVVGGPVGAAVGGVAGAAVGGAASGPDRTVIVHEHDNAVPVETCSTSQVQRSDSLGNSSTTTRTNCP